MPYLIAVTPRAGRWNHRTLVANNWHEDILELDQLVQMARQQLRGDAWLAVVHTVKQFNSEREGDELLILGDVAVEKLSPEDIDDITAKLTRCLESDLTQLITATIDWTQEGKTDPIKRSELTDCYHHLFTELALPPAIDNLLWNESCARRDMSKQKEKTKNKQNKKMILAVAGAVVLVIALAVSAATFFDLFNKESMNKVSVLNESVCNLFSQDKVEECTITQTDYNELCVILAYQSGKECDKKLELIQAADIPKNFKTNVFDQCSIDNPMISLSTVASDEIQAEINTRLTTINPQQYKLIREYQVKIRSAWQALVTFNKERSNKIQSDNGDFDAPNKDAYDVALQEIKTFLNDYESTIKQNNELADFQMSGFFTSCQSSDDKITITQRIVDKSCNTENADWKKIPEHFPPASQKSRFIEVYKAIFELKAPNF